MITSRNLYIKLLIYSSILNIFNHRLDYSIRLIEANLIVYSLIDFDIELIKLSKFLDKSRLSENKLIFYIK
jgi:hypothetical protein